MKGDEKKYFTSISGFDSPGFLAGVTGGLYNSLDGLVQPDTFQTIAMLIPTVLTNLTTKADTNRCLKLAVNNTINEDFENKKKFIIETDEEKNLESKLLDELKTTYTNRAKNVYLDEVFIPKAIYTLKTAGITGVGYFVGYTIGNLLNK